MNANPKAGNPILGGSRRLLRVLIVEDSEPDFVLLRLALERGGFDLLCERVETAEAMALAMQKQPWDLVLADHAMPHFSAPQALELLKNSKVDIPFLIVSGHIEEATAVAAMKAGAHDYVMKDRLARLVPAVERELREAEVRQARAKSEADLRQAHEELEMRVEKRTTDLRTANVKLESVIEERKRLETELLEIAENERRRIGFDLHDDLGQKLTGISLMIKGLEQTLAGQQHPCCRDARKIQSLLDQLIRHTHNLAHEFSALDARGDDLPTVLRQLAETVKRTFSVPCEVPVKGTVPDLPSHTSAQLYKIAQEALSNAIKHGKATQLWLGLTCTSSKLVLTIKNNGRPFSPPAAGSKRMGLRIMNFRANTIGAVLEIKPAGRSGTVVTCALPVNHESKPAKTNSDPVTKSGTHHRRPALECAGVR